ncbi:hypothetical protein BYT27DRAFT_7110552 [Phlegmacium glaucopus]|nr:hypothetical protein BYT27DRAFT_7110552 [Phlegmacium glaucopus]
MSSSDGGLGSFLAGRIQNISALLPLLGTEQCEVQVSSALSQGFHRALVAPISIFGSLGIVSAGYKTLVACISFRGIFYSKRTRESSENIEFSL